MMPRGGGLMANVDEVRRAGGIAMPRTAVKLREPRIPAALNSPQRILRSGCENGPQIPAEFS